MLSCFSCVQLFVTLWTIARQAPLCMGFSRQEYWSGLPCLPPGDLPNPGIKPRSSALQVDLLPAEPQGKARNNGVGIGENGGQMECSFTTGGNLKVSPLWKKSHFLIKLNMYLPCDSIISLLSIYIRKTKPYDDKKICT